MSLESDPHEFVRSLRLCIEVLNKCNIRIIDDDGSSFKKYWNYCFMLLCLTLHFASLTEFLLKVFIETTKAADLAFTLPIYVYHILAIFKAVVLISNKEELRFIIHELGTGWRVKNITKVQTLRKKALLKTLEICQKTYYYMVMAGSLTYCLKPLIELILRRFILHQEMKLSFPFPCSYPFDPFHNWFLYAGLYVLQIYSTNCYIYAYLGAELLMIALCSLISTEFSLLQEDMRNVKSKLRTYIEEDDDKFQMTIEDFVKKHQRLIKLSEQVDGIFNKINFITFCFSTVSVAFYAFGGSVAHGMYKALNYLAVIDVLISLLILCYYGEMLRLQSAGIADAAYNNLWYKGKTQYQKSIALIITRSQRPCCLTMLKYTPITMNTFSQVLSTTWSYLSLLSRLYEEN